MGYFAGLGAGRGWVSLKFTLTPDELSKIFDGLEYSFVITNTRVESNYDETSKQDFFQAYKCFFEQILIGQQPLTEKETWEIEGSIYQSVIDDINKIVFEEITDKKDKPLPYKLAEPLEPVINIRPFHLFYRKETEKESLSTAYYNEKGGWAWKYRIPNRSFGAIRRFLKQ